VGELSKTAKTSQIASGSALNRGSSVARRRARDRFVAYFSLVSALDRPLPQMTPYSRHVFVCTGAFCSPRREGVPLYARLAELLERAGLLFGTTRVKRGETPCLGVCEGGPIVVVYPEGVWYAGVDEELLERIVAEHLKEGRVVESAVFHRLGA